MDILDNVLEKTEHKLHKQADIDFYAQKRDANMAWVTDEASMVRESNIKTAVLACVPDEHEDKFIPEVRSVNLHPPPNGGAPGRTRNDILYRNEDLVVSVEFKYVMPSYLNQISRHYRNFSGPAPHRDCRTGPHPLSTNDFEVTTPEGHAMYVMNKFREIERTLDRATQFRAFYGDTTLGEFFDRAKVQARNHALASPGVTHYRVVLFVGPKMLFDRVYELVTGEEEPDEPEEPEEPEEGETAADEEESE